MKKTLFYTGISFLTIVFTFILLMFSVYIGIANAKQVSSGKNCPDNPSTAIKVIGCEEIAVYPEEYENKIYCSSDPDVSKNQSNCSDVYEYYRAKGGGHPLAAIQPWGLTGFQTPIIPAGATIDDGHGITETCNKQFKMGCFNIFGTEYYINYQLNSAKRLLAKYGRYAYTLFPSFSGWLNEIR